MFLLCSAYCSCGSYSILLWTDSKLFWSPVFFSSLVYRQCKQGRKRVFWLKSSPSKSLILSTQKNCVKETNIISSHKMSDFLCPNCERIEKRLSEGEQPFEDCGCYKSANKQGTCYHTRCFKDIKCATSTFIHHTQKKSNQNCNCKNKQPCESAWAYIKEHKTWHKQGAKVSMARNCLCYWKTRDLKDLQTILPLKILEIIW